MTGPISPTSPSGPTARTGKTRAGRPTGRDARRQLVIWALAVCGLLLGAGTALAHNVLIGSDPPAGARLATGPARVTLRFDLPVRDVFSAITVVGPDRLHYEAGPSRVSGNTVGAPVSPLGPAGQYQVGYRIVSDDGHPVSGSIAFTLTAPGPGHGIPERASPAAAQQSTGTERAPGTSGGDGPWWLVIGGVVLVAAGGLLAWRLGR